MFIFLNQCEWVYDTILSKAINNNNNMIITFQFKVDTKINRSLHNDKTNGNSATRPLHAETQFLIYYLFPAGRVHRYDNGNISNFQSDAFDRRFGPPYYHPNNTQGTTTPFGPPSWNYVDPSYHNYQNSSKSFFSYTPNSHSVARHYYAWCTVLHRGHL